MTTAYFHSELRNELLSDIDMNLLLHSFNLEYRYQFCIITSERKAIFMQLEIS
jgi:hypothetical protein